MLEIRQTCLKTNMLESVRDLRPCPGAGLKPGPVTGPGNHFPKTHIEAETDDSFHNFEKYKLKSKLDEGTPTNRISLD